jgi:hypothetical protein
MKNLPIYLNICILLFSVTVCYGCEAPQNKGKSISIPAAGNSWVINDLSKSGKVVTTKGITGWNDPDSRIRTYFRVEKPGDLTISIRARVNTGISEIEVTLGTEKKSFTLKNVTFDTIYTGIFKIEKPGYQWIELKGISKSGDIYAEVSDFVISGSASEGKVYYVKDDFYFGRRGPSVHLRYDIPAEASDIVWFYNEITIPEGNDVLGSYYMANGFTDGYFGIQCNSETERRILFSVWSPYKTDNPGEIPDEYKIILLKKGADVITKEFGNEGSGGQSYRKYFWKTGNTYRFLLKGEPSVNNSTDYTAYFFTPETGKWELIASFRRPKTNNYLKNLYSFLENFMPETGPLERKGYYSNQWVCNKDGKWFELTNAKFTADATARKESRLDYSGGSENGMFFLRNCGFFSDKTNMDQIFSRPATGKQPEIDLSGLE